MANTDGLTLYMEAYIGLAYRFAIHVDEMKQLYNARVLIGIRALFYTFYKQCVDYVKLCVWPKQ